MKSLYSFDQYKENVSRLIRNLNAENLKLDHYFGCSTSTATLVSKRQSTLSSSLSSTFPSPQSLDAYPTISIQVHAINNAINNMFRPDVRINEQDRNDVETLKTYLTGGISYDAFRVKSNTIFRCYLVFYLIETFFFVNHIMISCSCSKRS